MKKLCFAVMAMCMLLSCGGKNEKEAATEEATLSGLMKSDFVSEVDGKPTALYVLKNKKGAEACVTNWGGRLVSVMVPDKNGKMTDTARGIQACSAADLATGNYITGGMTVIITGPAGTGKSYFT